MDFSLLNSEKACGYFAGKIRDALKSAGAPALAHAARAEATVPACGRAATGAFRFMEVCGTHTMTAARCGLSSTLPAGVELVSGPGCPVCVTPNDFVDRAIAYSRLPDVIITTFGDMVRVPGTASSLEKERAAGADIQVIYSPADGVKIASENPDKKIIFLGVGFETTAPLVAATLLDAQKRSLKNWFLLSAHKLIPPALRALAQTPDLKIDGFLLPGHVSAIIGSGPYEFISREYGLPCAITGFEPADIYEGIYLLVKQKLANRPCVEIQYRRAVRPGGNPKAVEIMNRVFETADSSWRGIGVIPGSGMAIAGKYSSFDAAKMIKVEVPESRENEGCRCGDVLKGLITPPDCPLFASACTPERPVGACMVSSEGACAAFYKYKRER